MGSQQLVSIPIWMCLSQSLALFLCNTVTLRYSGTLLVTMAEMHSWRLEQGCFSVQGHMSEWFQLGSPLSLVVWWSWGSLTFIKLCHPLLYDHLPLSHTFPFTQHTPVTWGFTLASPGFGQAEQFRNNDGREKEGNKTTQEWQQVLLGLQWMLWGIQHGFLKDGLLHP